MAIQSDFFNFIEQHSDAVFFSDQSVSNEKNALVFVHTLSYGGSQTALCSLLSRLKESGYSLWILSPLDGPFRETYLQNFGANCIIHTFLMDDSYKKMLRNNFDLVVLNSICSNYYAYPFINTDIPVLFWIHESTNFLKQNTAQLIHPAFVSDNFHYIAAWPDAADGFQKIFTRKADILPIEIKDVYDGYTAPTSDVCHFLIPGAYVEQKGFHAVLQVIQNLPANYMEKSHFTFLGHIGNENYYNQLKEAASSLPNVTILGEVPFSEMKTYYKNCDCVISPSFFDAGPMTVVEAMMMKKLCIVSNLCGVSSFISDCKNGFVYPGENLEELYKRIILVISDKDSLTKIAEKGRETYESNFTKEAIDKKYQQLLDQYITR